MHDHHGALHVAGCNVGPYAERAIDRRIDRIAIRGVGRLQHVVDDLALRPLGSVWHKFDGEGGVTGLVALTESHLACHTYPEHGTATFNLYCCRERPEWDWTHNLGEMLGARSVYVTKIDRGDGEESNAPISRSVGGDA